MHPLTSCLWEMTLRCNLRCLHCGSSAGRRRTDELDLDECRSLAHQILALGCRNVTLIGGEILLVRGWHDIARLLSDHGAKVNIMSNGLGYTRESVEQIRHGKLTNVGISIDGLQEQHNWIRNHRRSFQQACAALDLLRDTGISTAVVTCLFESNIDDLDGLYEVLVERGVQIWQLQLANAMGRQPEGGGRLVPRRRVGEITSFVRRRRAEGRVFVYAADSIGYHDRNEPYIRGGSQPLSVWEGCQAGLTSVFIDSVGNVKGCGSLYADRFIEGNVRQVPLASIWNDPSRFTYNRAFRLQQLSGACRSCDLGAFCRGGCRSSNYFNNEGKLFESTTCVRYAHQDAWHSSEIGGSPPRLATSK